MGIRTGLCRHVRRALRTARYGTSSELLAGRTTVGRAEPGPPPAGRLQSGGVLEGFGYRPLWCRRWDSNPHGALTPTVFEFPWSPPTPSPPFPNRAATYGNSARARRGRRRPESCGSGQHGHTMATTSAQESPPPASRRCRFCYHGMNVGIAVPRRHDLARAAGRQGGAAAAREAPTGAAGVTAKGRCLSPLAASGESVSRSWPPTA